MHPDDPKLYEFTCPVCNFHYFGLKHPGDGFQTCVCGATMEEKEE